MRGRCAIAGKKLQDENIVQSLTDEFNKRIKENKNRGRRTAVIPGMATERGMFPWMVFRAILIKHIELKSGQSPSKKMIQSYIRSPHLIKVGFVSLKVHYFKTLRDFVYLFLKI